MDLDIGVAKHTDDYIDLALELGRHPSLRQERESQILARKTRLFDDDQVIEQHHRVFRQLIEEARS